MRTDLIHFFPSPLAGERVRERGNPAVLSLLLPLILASCTEAPPPTTAPVVAKERWVTIRPAGQSATREAPARVLPGPSSIAVVTTPLRATVMKVRASAGDLVDAGTPLIDVVMPEALDAAGRAEGARVRLDAWTERHTQLTALRAEGLARSLEVSEAAARVAEAKADLQAARSLLLVAGLRDESAASLLKGNGLLSLRAPMTGVITQVQATLGESREPNSGPLLSLASTGANRVESRSPHPLGAASRYEFIWGEGRCDLTLVSAAPTADPHDGAFLAWFEPTAPLPAGTLGRLVVHGDARDVYSVEASAIQRTEGVTRVISRRGPLTVEVLRCESVDCLVVGGVQAGDEVVVAR